MSFINSIKIGGSSPVEIFYKAYGLDSKGQDIVLGQPTLIWLHGGPGFDHAIHEPFISTLVNYGLQVILIDQRGQGRSGGQNEPENWHLAQWGDDVFEFCQSMGIENPIVGGVSYGGVVAQSYMLQHPEHPAGIILCDTDSRMNKDKMLTTYYERAKTSYLSQGISNQEAEKKAVHVKEIALRFFEGSTDELCLKEYISDVLPLCGENKFNTDRPMDCILRMDVARKYFQNELFTYDFRAEFKNVQCPVLVMYGDKNIVHPKESAEETIAALPTKYVYAEYFKDATTPVYDNEPERARKCISEFSVSSYQLKCKLKGMQRTR